MRKLYKFVKTIAMNIPQPEKGSGRHYEEREKDERRKAEDFSAKYISVAVALFSLVVSILGILISIAALVKSF